VTWRWRKVDSAAGHVVEPMRSLDVMLLIRVFVLGDVAVQASHSLHVSRPRSCRLKGNETPAAQRGGCWIAASCVHALVYRVVCRKIQVRLGSGAERLDALKKHRLFPRRLLRGDALRFHSGSGNGGSILL